MSKVIYVDFDGVLVDTPKLIKEEIKNKGSGIEVYKKFPWGKFLRDCCEIENNFSSIMEIAQKFKVIILTRVYSNNEQIEKEKFVFNNLNGIEIITVPYYIEKNDMVNSDGNILIDDYKINIEKWIQSGGIGIYVDSEKNLNKLLNEYLK